ncbi:MAG TPA: proline dehydrogenase family protein [Actinomycetota bacterium]|nr:proline dehydrogenase family protein [Actinomycetota bacterium]
MGISRGGFLLGRALLWASEKPRVRSALTKGKLTKGVVGRFVAGDELDSAIAAIRDLNSRSIGGILDLLGEGVTDPRGAAAAADEYLKSIKVIAETGIDTTVSVKLTQLGLAFDKSACLDHLTRLADEAASAGAGVEVDMEQSDYVSDTLDVYRLLRAAGHDVRLAIQAYLRRTPADLQSLVELRPKIRLVKGAYSEPPEIAFVKRREIDGQYAWLSEWLFEHGREPGIASHDGALIEHAQKVAARTGAGKQGFEIQMLYGIRRDLQHKLAAEGYRVRVYVPYGSDWYPYLMRRLAERPANLRFFARAVLGR